MQKKPKNQLHTAIFHQFLDNIGGAEIVTLTLARELNADIYTTNIDRDKIAKLGFADMTERIHSIGRIPVKAPWRHQAALWRFSRLNLSEQYDQFMISGDWAVSAAKHNTPTLWYVHSPCRELWDLREYVRNNLVPRYGRFIFDLWSIFNRWLHVRYMRKIDTIVCNSANTQTRLKTYLNIDAAIIHPPCDTDSFTWKPAEGYWLSVNRLLAHKRIELQLDAFRRLPDEKLVVVGSYEKNARQFEEYRAELEAKTPDNVEFRYWVSDTELKDLYARTKGLICTAKDEDFGMTPVEAMAAGKPVVAPNEGGYKETIIDKQTGYLLDTLNANALADAIREIGPHTNTYKSSAENRAATFDTAPFIEQIQQAIDNGTTNTYNT